MTPSVCRNPEACQYTGRGVGVAMAGIIQYSERMRFDRRFARGARRWRAQLRSALLLRGATEAMEVEDFDGAHERFRVVLGLDAPPETRLMAYHGAVIALLRLGRYSEALSLGKDAQMLLRAWPEGEGRDVIGTAREALEQAESFARWALSHPLQAREIREREKSESVGDPATPSAPLPLGHASGWPAPLRVGYQLLINGLVTSGLVVAAANRREMARRLLLVARYASQLDRQLERDVLWHLSRVDEQLGRHLEAQSSRARYELLNQEVRSALRRLRWTN